MMASIVSSLDLERERQLMKLLPESARLHLLYKGSHHGYDKSIISKFDKVGQFMILVYLKTGSVRGAYLSKPPKEKQGDKSAFLFEFTPDSVFQYLPRDQARAVDVNGNDLSFGKSLKFMHGSWANTLANTLTISFGTDQIFSSAGWKKDHCADYSEVELHRVENAEDMLPWRDLSWGDNDRLALKEKLVSFKPACQSLNRIRVLLLGPAGSGKSSFINSVRFAMQGKVLLLPNIGVVAGGFTKRLKSYNIRSGSGGNDTALTLVDVLALEDGNTGLTLSDTLAVIKGHAPQGHKFQRDAPIDAPCAGYKPEPKVNDEIRCAAFVLNACKVTTYTENQQATIRRFHAELADLDIPQVVLLTHVDQVCHAVQEDVKHVYSSRTVHGKMKKAAEVVSLPMSYVVPVKNYTSELSVNCNTDILILSAVNHILQAVDDTYEESRPPPPLARTSRVHRPVDV